MNNTKTKPTEQELISTILHLMGKLREYATEDLLANQEGVGCFSDPDRYIFEVMHNASKILGRYYHGQTTGGQPPGDAKTLLERAEELLFALRPGAENFHATLIDKWLEDKSK